MVDSLNKILCRLQNGTIDVDKTIREIENIDYSASIKEKPMKNARKLKVHITAIDNNEGGKVYKFNIPGLPFWMLKMFGSAFVKFTAKQSKKRYMGFKIDNVDNTTQIVKSIIDALAKHPPFELVNVDSKDAKVHVYTK